MGSTTGIMDFAEKSDAREFIIGTENSIVEHLQFACPEKQFYPLSPALTCGDMKLTTLVDMYQALLGTGGEEILLPDRIMEEARKVYPSDGGTGRLNNGMFSVHDFTVKILLFRNRNTILMMRTICAKMRTLTGR